MRFNLMLDDFGITGYFGGVPGCCGMRLVYDVKFTVDDRQMYGNIMGMPSYILNNWENPSPQAIKKLIPVAEAFVESMVQGYAVVPSWETNLYIRKMFSEMRTGKVIFTDIVGGVGPYALWLLTREKYAKYWSISDFAMGNLNYRDSTNVFVLEFNPRIKSKYDIKSHADTHAGWAGLYDKKEVA